MPAPVTLVDCTNAAALRHIELNCFTTGSKSHREGEAMRQERVNLDELFVEIHLCVSVPLW